MHAREWGHTSGDHWASEGHQWECHQEEAEGSSREEAEGGTSTGGDRRESEARRRDPDIREEKTGK